jgi:protein-S-isoprenylcysteine O-methyltransferase Ste14
LRKSECGIWEEPKWGGFVSVAVASSWIKLSEEEKLMRQQFLEQYQSYEQRVKRIIPFVL